MTDDYGQLVAQLRDVGVRKGYYDDIGQWVDDGDLLRQAANAIEMLDPDAERNSWRNSEIRKLQARVLLIEKERDYLMAAYNSETDRALVAEVRVRELEDALPSADKLDLLAFWIDTIRPNDPDPEVQNDLRK